MYHHVKKLMYTVNIGEPDVRFGNMLLEQFGGANGDAGDLLLPEWHASVPRELPHDVPVSPQFTIPLRLGPYRPAMLRP